MLETISSASAARSAIWFSFRVLRRVTVFSMNSVPFRPESTLRIRPALVGAQLPFSISATVRFCRLWLAMSCTRFSMLTKMPAL